MKVIDLLRAYSAQRSAHVSFTDLLVIVAVVVNLRSIILNNMLFIEIA